MINNLILNTLIYIKPSSKFYYTVLTVIALIAAALAFIILRKIYVHK